MLNVPLASNVKPEVTFLPNCYNVTVTVLQCHTRPQPLLRRHSVTTLCVTLYPNPCDNVTASQQHHSRPQPCDNVTVSQSYT